MNRIESVGILLSLLLCFPLCSGCSTPSAEVTIEKSILEIDVSVERTADAEGTQVASEGIGVEIFRLLPDGTEVILEQDVVFPDTDERVHDRITEELTNEEHARARTQLGARIRVAGMAADVFQTPVSLPVSETVAWPHPLIELRLGLESREVLVTRRIEVSETERRTDDDATGRLYRVHEDDLVVFRSERLSEIRAYLDAYYGLTLEEVPFVSM